ncbi:MAG: oligoendopeptidase F [Candidatus Nanohaloarchaea archaeon]
MEVKEREEIDDRFKWDKSSLYDSFDEWEKDFERVKEEFEKLKDLEGELSDSEEKVLEAFKLYDRLSRTLDDLVVYARMSYQEDMRRDDAKARLSRARSLKTNFKKASSFIKPQVLEWDRSELESFFGEKGELEKYDHKLDNIFRREEHILSRELEKAIANLGEVFSSSSEIYSAFMNADLTFPSVEREGEEMEITTSNFTKLQRDSDRDFREKVYRKFYDRIREYDSTIGSTIEKEVKKNVRLAEMRNYGSAQEAALDRENIPVSIYSHLNEKADNNLDLLQRFVELKRKALDVEQMNFWDIYMPLSESDEEIGYSEARNKVSSALSVLGEDYTREMEAGIDSGWIDVYENKGKRSGAFSGGTYDSDPYILMNYQDDIDSMYTLAHEMGHSMHSLFTCRNQPYVKSNYSTYVAEIASTTNEVLLTEHLLDNLESRELKLKVLGHFLDNFRNTFFRQAMFSQLEKWMHEEVEDKGSLTSSEINDRYGELKNKFFRNVEVDERIKSEWMRIHHFFTWNFYVFQYSTGVTAGIAFGERIMDGKRERYMDMLRKGGSEYPVEMVRNAGVDLASDEPYDQALSVFEDYLERAEKLV